MNKRVSKQDYLTEEILELEKQLSDKKRLERERLIINKMIDKLSPERQQLMLDELSKKLAAK